MHLLRLPYSQKEETARSEAGLHRIISTNTQFNDKSMKLNFCRLLGSHDSEIPVPN